MVGEKLLVDQLAAAEAFIHTVPELNSKFAEPPAETNFLAMIKAGKIQKTDVEILHLTPVVVNTLKRLLQAAG